ncbi:MAG: PKD domain-containing protein [Thermoplasmatota archaeon]
MSLSPKDLRKFVPGAVTAVIVIGTTAALLFLSLDTDDPPHARIIHTSDVVGVGHPITFDGTNSSDPEGRELKYSWTINESMFTEEPVFLYSFPAPGNFTVVLKVTDTGGHFDTETVIIEVTDDRI